jgi:hypothetical protein
MTSFRFRAPEFHYKHKTTDWYWAVGIITIAAAATAIIFSNILFGILIIIAGFTLIMHASRIPAEHDIEINDAGITIGNFHFTYGNLESFWIEHHENGRMLIRTKRLIMPHLVVPLDSLSEDEKEDMRDFLRTKLAEIEQQEPLFELIMEYIGF